MAVLTGKHRVGSLLAGALLLAGLALAGEVWKEKPASEWTAEEALEVLTDSPWAHREFVGFVLPLRRAGSRGGRGGGRESTGAGPPPLFPPGGFGDNVGSAVYLVRWESAGPVADAFARLEELGEQVSARFQSPPPVLPDDRYVITVKTTRPPRGVPDPLARADAGELLENARLKTRPGSYAPLEVARSGMGASAAVHFFFPRTVEGQPLFERGQVEFRYQGGRFTLKSKFRLEPEAIR